MPLDDPLRHAQEVGDFLRQKAQRDPKLQSRIEAAAVFGELKEHPAWRRLYEVVKEHQTRYLDRLTRRMWETEFEPGSVRRELDYTKGFYQGALWIISQPELADTALHRVAEAMYQRYLNEPIIDMEEDAD